MKCLYSRFLASQAKTIIHYPINFSVRLLYRKPLFVKANIFRFTIIPPQLIGSRSGKFVTTSYPQKIIQAILESSSFAMRVKSTFRCFCFLCGHEYTYIIQTYVYIYTYIYIYIYIYICYNIHMFTLGGSMYLSQCSAYFFGLQVLSTVRVCHCID